MIKSKKYYTQQKSLKARDNQKICKKMLISSIFGKHMASQNERIKDVEYVI